MSEAPLLIMQGGKLIQLNLIPYLTAAVIQFHMAARILYQYSAVHYPTAHGNHTLMSLRILLPVLSISTLIRSLVVCCYLLLALFGMSNKMYYL